MATQVSLYVNDLPDLNGKGDHRSAGFDQIGEAIQYAKYLLSLSPMGFVTIDNGQHVMMLGFTNTPLGREFGARGQYLILYHSLLTQKHNV